jgi:hypothetical protein
MRPARAIAAKSHPSNRNNWQEHAASNGQCQPPAQSRAFLQFFCHEALIFDFGCFIL